MSRPDEIDVLFECVDAFVEAAMSGDTYVLLNGERVKRGSAAHIKDLQGSIKDLERRRDGEKRGSASRDTYARAISRLRIQLKKALAAANKMKKNLGITG